MRLIELTQDDLRTQVEAFVLRHQVIQEGFVGSSGYFYTIRATVKGQAAQGLRLQLLSESTDADEVHEKARALLRQALSFYTGASGRIDLSQARALLMQAAELEDALAIMWLARCYHRGCAGFGQDLQHSRRLAAQVVQEVERLAYIGDAQALFLLGDAYQAGLAVKQDPQQALSWYRKAAEQGHLMAQQTLGVMYVKGRGTPQNDAEAVQWYRRAAEQNDSAAQYHLGFMYERGEGVEKSRDAAVRWYRRAAEHGNAEAQQRLQKLQSRE